MATGAKRGGDMVLGGRHLVGIFAALVVLFGVVFTLGYVLGRGHYDAQLRAADNPVSRPADAAAGKPSAGAGPSAEGQTLPRAADWDFYRSAEPAKPAERLAEQPKTVSAAKAP